MVDTKVNLSKKLNALYWIMRPLNSITAAVAVVVAIHLAYGDKDPFVNPLAFVFIGSAAFFVTAHSMTHNDIVDYEIDLINAPHRALPSNILSMKEAKLWAVFLGVLAVLSGVVIDILLGILPFSTFWAIINMGILDLYNSKLKQSGLLGNLVIGYVVSALFIYADIVVNQGLTLRTESIGLYAFFLIWGREVLKDVMDIEGDREHGMRTIPVRFGANTGAVIGSLIIGIGILSSIPLILNPINGNLLVPVMLVILNTIIIIMCVRVIRNPDKDLIYRTKLWLLRMLLFALLILAATQLFTLYF